MNESVRREIKTDELRKIQLDILRKVDRFCSENHITYYLFAGTLIGAARHGGYIPWDDDLDICMKREDYDRFFQYFNAARDDMLKAICHENTSEYYLASGKVINTQTVMQENVQSDYPIGVYIDIFPMDYMPGNTERFKKIERHLKCYRSLLILKNVKVQKGRSLLKNLALIVSHLLLKPISHRFILNKIRQYASQYMNQHDSSFKIGDVSVFTYGTKELFPISDFEGTSQLEFEGRMWPVPINYKHVLSSMYGDYMKLPPKEKRISHHDFYAYWKE